MRKTKYTTVTIRVPVTTASVLKKLPHGTRGIVVEDLVTNHPQTITKTLKRYISKRAA